MAMPSECSTDQLKNQAIERLQQDCIDALESYKRSHAASTDVSSCAEIVRRAAKRDDDALGVLLGISYRLVEQKCPDDLRSSIDDVQQEVALRLIRKFHNEDSPFRASTFPAYRSYLNLTIRSVVENMRERRQKWESKNRELEKLELEKADFKSRDLSALVDSDGYQTFRTLSRVLADPIQREVIWCRHVLDQSPDEITEALRLLSLEITKQEVYRLLERGIRRLRKRPKGQGLFQENIDEDE
jgi:hypothetical protein